MTPANVFARAQEVVMQRHQPTFKDYPVSKSGLSIHGGRDD
jgi:hypothetical protein